MRSRRTTAAMLIAVDMAAVVAACSLAFLARFDVVLGGSHPRIITPDWSLAVYVVAVLVVFYALGLYKMEVFVSRPLHVWTLAKGCALAFFGSALVVYLAKSPAVQQSRFIVLVTFLVLFVLAAVARVAVIDRLWLTDLRRARPQTLVVGRGARIERLTRRLGELRGFSDYRVVDPGDNGCRPAYRAVGAAVGEGVEGNGSAPLRFLFLDAGSLPPATVLELTALAKAVGVEVYVVSELLSSLDSTRLLMELFEIPVMRVRRSPKERQVGLVKRVFDVLFASLLLVVLAPLLLAIALLVKVTSRGPVLFAQERIGVRGLPFRFYKFRSMEVDNDASEHRHMTRQFIDGGYVCPEDAPDDLAFKLADDPRVTRIGGFLRRYSLDELPQLVNVIRGDMSLVGPRPALAYEVERYQRWHRERLTALPGISGVWQVHGRSRVGFDEMVLEDIMYIYNQSLLTDLGICLRTVPVVLLARGAA